MGVRSPVASETLTEDPALSRGTLAQLQLQGHSLPIRSFGCEK